MNPRPDEKSSTQFPLQISPRFIPCLDRIAKRYDVSEFIIRVSLSQTRGMVLDSPAVFDPENDFLLRGALVQVFINRQEAYRFRGWILETASSLDVLEAPKFSPPYNRSTASNPGRLVIDRKLVCKVQTELSGWSGWLWRRRDRITGENRFEGSFDWIANHINNGDSRAAIVLETSPKLLVAAYSDEFDCALGLKFPASVAKFHQLQVGDRLVTCNQYAVEENAIHPDLKLGSKALMNQPFSNFRPMIANFVSSDSARLQQLETGFASTEWTRLEIAAGDWMQRYREGKVQPRIGAPLWAHASSCDPPLIDVPIWERAVAAVFDLVLVTLLVAVVWWSFLGFDEIFRQYLANPRQPGARALFKETGRQIQFVASVVFLIYCAVMLASPLQATIGKLLFRMRVVSRDSGKRISVFTGFHRALMLLLGVFPAFWSLVNSVEREALHDKAAGTRVVRIVES